MNRFLPILATVACTTSAIVGYLYVTKNRDVSVHQPTIQHVKETPFADTALLQKDTVSPRGKFSGIVYYPVPYGSPPNLKLTSAKRPFDILEQDGTSFTWVARLMKEDFATAEYAKDRNVLDNTVDRMLTLGYLKPDLVLEDFTWEARGVRHADNATRIKKLEQKGSFTCPVGEEGIQHFPIPFDSAPHVELKTTLNTVVIVDCTDKSFKWKNSSKHPGDYGTIQWIARGVRTGDVGK